MRLNARFSVPALRHHCCPPPTSASQASLGIQNGYFKTLKQIVHFYNTRDIKPVCENPLTRVEDAIDQNCWPEPEVAENVNTTELGDLRLTDAEEDAIVAFLKTLSDGYMP